MVYINNCVISGNLGNEAEKGDAKGTPVVNFRFANTSPFGQKNTTWFNASFFGQQAERLFNDGVLFKGQSVIVVGEISNREYQDKEGNTRQSLDFRVEKLQYLKSNGETAVVSADDDAF